MYKFEPAQNAAEFVIPYSSPDVCCHAPEADTQQCISLALLTSPPTPSRASPVRGAQAIYQRRSDAEVITQTVAAARAVRQRHKLDGAAAAAAAASPGQINTVTHSPY